MPLLTGTGGIIHGDNWNCIGVCRRGPGSGLGLLRGLPAVWGEVGGVKHQRPGKVLSDSDFADHPWNPGSVWTGGLVFCLNEAGLFSGELRVLTGSEGTDVFGGLSPMAIGGLLSAIAQGEVCSGRRALVIKRSEELSKAIIMAIMVEFYAILCLLASFLMLNSL